MKWLCKIGIHFYRSLGFTNLLLSDSLEECWICGAGRAWFCFGQAYAKYTPEQMALYKSMINRAPSCTPNALPRSTPDRPS